MTTFYMIIPCGECVNDNYVFMETLLTHNGFIAVPADMAEQVTFRCRDCGMVNYTGELDVFAEDEDEGGSANGTERAW